MTVLERVASSESGHWERDHCSGVREGGRVIVGGGGGGLAVM